MLLLVERILPSQDTFIISRKKTNAKNTGAAKITYLLFIKFIEQNQITLV